jgi:hypothetical protein
MKNMHLATIFTNELIRELLINYSDARVLELVSIDNSFDELEVTFDLKTNDPQSLYEYISDVGLSKSLSKSIIQQELNEILLYNNVGKVVVSNDFVKALIEDYYFFKYNLDISIKNIVIDFSNYTNIIIFTSKDVSINILTNK